MENRLAPSQIPFESTRYEWMEYFGGNMADVYLARELRTERVVIIKVLKTEYCSEEELQLRFAQEARLACQCQHPNIVTTYYADEAGGRPYIAMEHVQGETLRALMQRGGIETQEQVFWIGLQLAQALGYLQVAQIVHRDLKPDNVVVDAKGCAKLLDFGIARLKDSRMTEIGVRIGTMKYMSPEQVSGGALTFHSDMYAFGVVLFEMLTLKLPYTGDGTEQFFRAILEAEPNFALLKDANVPADVIGIIRCCLQKDPAKRYCSFAEIIAVLKPLVSPDRLEQLATSPFPAIAPSEKTKPSSRLPLILAAAAVALILVGAGIWFALKKSAAPAPITTPAAVSNTLKSPTGDMVRVEAGSALLGAGANPVTLPAFYIDVTEVTNAAYLLFCRQTGRAIPPDAQSAAADNPVVNITFADAAAFAKWAGKRLPSEFEWEKAARGSKGNKFPWGNDWKPGAANIPPDRVSAKSSALAPARSFPSGVSPVGAFNMLGNAWEWVNAAAAPDEVQFARLEKLFTPPLSRTEAFYQTRGGSYRYSVPPGAEASLVFDNRPMPARTQQEDLGFRCAKDQ